MTWRFCLLSGLCVLVGCDVPKDPSGTLNRVRSNVVRVGITENDPWTSLQGHAPQGIDVELIEAFARQLNARIEWIKDSESDLFDSLERGECDVVIGGLRASTPWSAKVSLTQPYLRQVDQQYVMAVRQGENRWLLELDRFLQQHGPVGASGP